jgi:hypothetical protein
MPRNKSDKQNNSSYHSLHLWISFFVSMISLGIIVWNRRSVIPTEVEILRTAVIPVQTGIQSSSLDLEFLDSRLRGNDDSPLPVSTYQINFPNFFSSLALGALTYQLSSQSAAVLLSWPLFFAASVAAVSLGSSSVIPAFQVNPNPIGLQFGPFLTLLTSGDWVAMWLDDPAGVSNTTFYARRYANNGTALGGEFQVNSNRVNQNTYAVAMSLNSGSWVAAWIGGNQASDNYIYVQRYADNGTALGSEFQVNPNPTGLQFGPFLTLLTSGDWVVMWLDNPPGVSNTTFYARRYANNGTALGSEFQVNSNRVSQNYAVAMSLNSGSWVAAWIGGNQASDNYIYAQRYADNGTALGSEFQVNPNPIGLQFGPFLTLLTSGDWVAMWLDDPAGVSNTTFYARRYANNGTALGSEFQVNSNRVSQNYAVAMSLNSGSWVAAWIGGNEAGDNYIYAQRYADNGTALGSEFQVNPNPIGLQFGPFLTLLTSGDWVVMWLDNPLGVSNTTFYARRYANNGTALGSEFQVNSNRVSQNYAVAISLNSGGWVAAWIGGSDIYATIFSFTEPPTMLSTSSSTNAVISSSIQQQSTSTIGNNISVTTQKASTTNGNSTVRSTVIAAASVGGVIGLAACLGAIGFYAYRKKSRENKIDNVNSNEQSSALKKVENYQQILTAPRSQQPSNEYSILALAENKPAEESKYAKIDEMKKNENEYDRPTILKLD